VGVNGVERFWIKDGGSVVNVSWMQVEGLSKVEEMDDGSVISVVLNGVERFCVKEVGSVEES
uniref:hypothetical protein n=1 Tax=Bacillus pumilus TaxID=1408 RepID=UPI001C92FC35